MNEIINAVQPAVASAATLILTAVISAVGAKLVALINRRKEKVVAEIGTAEYNRKLGIAKQVWGAVDEYFRVTSNVQKTVDTASGKFAEMMGRALPGITTDEIKQMQAVVAGEVNAGRAALTATLPEQDVVATAEAVTLPADTVTTTA
jgi:hypothetical protein